MSKLVDHFSVYEVRKDDANAKAFINEVNDCSPYNDACLNVEKWEGGYSPLDKYRAFLISKNHNNVGYIYLVPGSVGIYSVNLHRDLRIKHEVNIGPYAYVRLIELFFDEPDNLRLRATPMTPGSVAIQYTIKKFLGLNISEIDRKGWESVCKDWKSLITHWDGKYDKEAIKRFSHTARVE